jgi:photosystem II stability/assembly factor-like uncharacterized protein
MKKIILLFLNFVFFNSISYSQSGWYIQSSPVSNYLSSIYFINSNTGIAVGYGGNILKTTNGGTNWLQKPSASTGLLSVYFINEFTGWAVGYSGLKIKTTDGGENWFNLPTSSYVLSSVYFLDSLLGFAAGGWTTGIIEKTTNGGISWTTTEFSRMFQLNSIYFINNNTGFCVGQDHGIPPYNTFYPILRTTNGGLSWNYISYYSSMDYFFVQFTSNDTGYVFGGNNDILKTTNNGVNWFLISNPGIFLPNGYFINNNTGYAVGYYGDIYKTTNGGYNWQMQQNPAGSITLWAVQFLDMNTGYIVGDDGLILKTTTGGSVGINNISSQIPSDYSLYQNYPNPFNPVTRIKFTVANGFPIRTFGNDKVVLKVLDVLGREVATLVNEKLNPGTYEVTFDGSNYPSGVYFYQLRNENFIETKKLILLK